MTPERFASLAAAYGGDLARWPDGERAAAEAFAAAQPELVAAALSAERALDASLDAYVVAAPAAGLRDKLLAAAPMARAAGRAWRWLTAAGLGLGLAASGAAGVAAGLTLAPASVARVFEGPPAAASDMNALADPVGDAASG